MTASVIPERSRLVVRMARLASRITLSPFFKISVRGIDNIPEKESFVLLPKHQRWEDIPLLAISIERPLYFVAKQELFDNFILKRLIAMMGGLPLDRNRPNRSRYTLSKIIQKLEQKEGVVIFPEGTYYKDSIGPGSTGLIRMIHSKADLLFIPAGMRYKYGKIRVNVQITLGKAVEGHKFENVAELFSHLMTQIAQLSGFKIRE